MKTYIGAKVIKAERMTQDMFERNIKENPDWADFDTVQGYHVVYPGHDGKPDYHSWSPCEVFDEAYRELNDGEVKFVKDAGKPERY